MVALHKIDGIMRRENDVDRGVLPPLSTEVHDQLLCFVDVEGEVIFLAPLRQGSHLLPVGCLVVVVIRPTTVV